MRKITLSVSLTLIIAILSVGISNICYGTVAEEQNNGGITIDKNTISDVFSNINIDEIYENVKNL